MLAYADTDEAIADVLRLSEGMTYKSAVAELPLGGGKGVIALPRGARLEGRARRAALLDFADTVEQLRGSYVTAEDVGTSTRDIGVIAERTTHVTGRSRRSGGSGDPSPFTALGVYHAIEATCERVFGTASLRGRSVAVIGLGHVGLELARRLDRAGARLFVTDVDRAKHPLARELGARWIAPATAMATPVDVLAPCALGGVLGEESIAGLQAPAIAGSANNQLASDEAADLLQARDILWAPDFVANAGGIINIAVELGPGGYDPRRARERTRAIGDTVRRVFDDAQADGVTPLAAALALARANLRAAAG